MIQNNAPKLRKAQRLLPLVLVGVGLLILACSTIPPSFSYGGPATIHLSAFGDVLAADTGEVGTFLLQPQNGALLRKINQRILATDGDLLFTLTVEDNEEELVAVRISDGTQVWQYQVGQIYGVAAANGIVYCLNHSAVLALSASTGTLLWQHTAYPQAFSLAAQDDTVYVITISAVYALRGSNGQERWSIPNYTNEIEYVGAARGVMYLHIDSTLSAIRVDSGAVLWSQGLESLPAPNGNYDAARLMQMALSDGALYGTVNNTLYAFRTRDGVNIWKYAGEATAKGPFKLLGASDGTAYLQEPGQITALRTTDGHVLWQQVVGTMSPALLEGPTIYTADGLFSGDTGHTSSTPSASCRFTLTLFALNVSDGSIAWSHEETYKCA